MQSTIPFLLFIKFECVKINEKNVVIVISVNIFDAIINPMAYHRTGKNGDTCKEVKVILCNGALKIVEALQEKYKDEHNGIFLSKKRAINILLSELNKK